MIKRLLDNFYLKTTLIIVALEVASFFTFLFPSIHNLLFILVTIFTAFLIYKKTEYGIYLFITELIIGGQGYLFSYEFDNFKISFRLVIFLLLFSIGMTRFLRKKDWSISKNKISITLLVLFTFIFISLITSLAKHKPLQDIFLDINGYLFFGLGIIFLTTKIPNLNNLKNNKIIKILLTASSWLAIKTILSLSLFSYGIAKVGDSLIYKWLRDTRVGEITQMNYPFYRIFFQSHIYNLISIFLILTVVFLYTKKYNKKQIVFFLFLLFLNFSAILISQSRSFWVSGFITLVFFLFSLIFIFKQKWQKILVFIFLIPTILVLNNLFISLVLQKNFNLISNRIVETSSNTSSVSSRSSQITPLLKQIKQAPIFGNGFAQKVNYTSDDPRIKNEQNPEGNYETYSFELGYLDIILKIGILGFLSYIFLLVFLMLKNFKLLKEKEWLVFTILGLLIIIMTDAFTPYLNHPLGIGFILITILLYQNNKKEII
ncbi:MAG: hypothetical protein COX80_01715 [Candidatus Magasanikbacteria bacterium CG_4_10_14_0_2_um_filter_33_14]|uniref:O-antigen ligase-related domain-containing protein n=1 Tax=Candidatus Magasanikbacteria bacterium CG_4_10_14_0_2_um_filter_33_14 TaxID=1974636 RepID=A0A2M7VBB1_9BACT|nr:MAG: hypothetical protein COX80_01715 [Candidatus Magasanikbacteria bacterium CG_4_10_14_0_2_um_filter_33_14]